MSRGRKQVVIVVEWLELEESELKPLLPFVSSFALSPLACQSQAREEQVVGEVVETALASRSPLPHLPTALHSNSSIDHGPSFRPTGRANKGSPQQSIIIPGRGAHLLTFRRFQCHRRAREGFKIAAILCRARDFEILRKAGPRASYLSGRSIERANTLSICSLFSSSSPRSRQGLVRLTFR